MSDDIGPRWMAASLQTSETTKCIMNDPTTHATVPYRDPQVVFDVRLIPGRVKHAQIFQRWFDLPVGQH